MCISYAESASRLKNILTPDCHKSCSCRFPNAAMAAIARDDEAEIRECCECPLPIFVPKVDLLQAKICRFSSLISSCSKLRRDEGPPEVQSLSERLVLLCKVPKGEEASSFMNFQHFRRNWQCILGDLSILQILN